MVRFRQFPHDPLIIAKTAAQWNNLNIVLIKMAYVSRLDMGYFAVYAEVPVEGTVVNLGDEIEGM